MKQQYLNAIYANLILQRDFEPVGTFDINLNPDLRLIQKHSHGVYFLLELVDGDKLTADMIAEKMSAAHRILSETDYQSIFHFIEVLVFNSTPTPDQIRAIQNGIQDLNQPRKYFSCFYVDLAAMQVSRQSTTSVNTDGVERLLKTYLKEPINNYQVLPDIQRLLELRRKEYSINFKTNKPIFTYTLIGINVVVWLFINLLAFFFHENYSDLNIIIGGKENLLILAGQWWRLITPIFLHGGNLFQGDVLHLLLNSYSLYVVGTIVERIYGYRKFLIIYFVAGIFGNIASFMFSIIPAVGASGSIFGLLGALVYYGIEKPKSFKKYFGYNIFAVIIINIVIGLSIPIIDNYAHLGGLTGGFLIAGAIGVSKPKSVIYRIMAIFLVLMVAFVGFYYGLNNKMNKDNYQIHQIQNKIEAKTIEPWEVEKAAEKVLLTNPTNRFLKINTLQVIIESEYMQGKFNQALEHAKILTKIDPLTGHYSLGILYYNNKQYVLAKKELLLAKKFNPFNKEINDIISKIISSK